MKRTAWISTVSIKPYVRSSKPAKAAKNQVFPMSLEGAMAKQPYSPGREEQELRKGLDTADTDFGDLHHYGKLTGKGEHVETVRELFLEAP